MSQLRAAAPARNWHLRAPAARARSLDRPRVGPGARGLSSATLTIRMRLFFPHSVPILPLRRHPLSYALGTWPGGQLLAIGRSGCYAENIARYTTLFGRGAVDVIPLCDISSDIGAVLERLRAAIRSTPRGAVGDAASPSGAPQRKLNAAAKLGALLEPSAAARRELAAFFEPHNEALFALIERELPWGQ